MAEIEAVARGRVWTGRDALGVGLVDELGGLRDAVRIARAAGRAARRRSGRSAPLHVPPLARLGRPKNSEDPRAASAVTAWPGSPTSPAPWACPPAAS